MRFEYDPDPAAADRPLVEDGQAGWVYLTDDDGSTRAASAILHVDQHGDVGVEITGDWQPVTVTPEPYCVDTTPHGQHGWANSTGHFVCPGIPAHEDRA